MTAREPSLVNYPRFPSDDVSICEEAREMSSAATSIDADAIATALGIHRWQLAAMLHSAAADEFRRLASMTYAGHDIDEDRIDRARRLHAAAVACEVDLEAEAVASGKFERRTS